MKNKKILIVEDEAIIALNIKLTLEDNGYSVLPIAHNAKYAYESAIENKPEIILMDINLQGEQDGIDAACQILKKINCSIIYLTGNIHLLDDDRLKNAPPYEILSKPPSDWKLLETIEKL